MLTLLLRGAGTELLHAHAGELTVVMRLLRRVEDGDLDDVTRYGAS